MYEEATTYVNRETAADVSNWKKNVGRDEENVWSRPENQKVKQTEISLMHDALLLHLEEEFRLKKRKKLSIFNDLLYVFSCCRDTKFLSFQTNLIDSQFRLLKSANPIQCFRNYLLLRAVMENISGSNISEEFVTLVSSWVQFKHSFRT